MPAKRGNAFYRDKNDYSAFAKTLCGDPITATDLLFNHAGASMKGGWPVCQKCADLFALLDLKHRTDQATKELTKYGYRQLMTTMFGRDRWQWKNEFFVDLGQDLSWTGWATTWPEPTKGKGLRSLSKYLSSYHS
jgi:hypothetical protein